MAIEHNGDVYSCDHYVRPDYLVGNVHREGLAEMADGPFQARFGRDKFLTLPDKCRGCRFLNLCYGACPKDRLLETKSGKLNWLCEGYLSFYKETEPYFMAMKRALQAGRAAGEYRRFLTRERPQRG